MKKNVLLSFIIIISLLIYSFFAFGCRPPSEKESKAQVTTTTEKKDEPEENGEEDGELSEEDKEDFARKVIAEQQESRADLRRLAEGDIKEIIINKVTKKDGKVIIDISVVSIGQDTEDGQIVLNEIIPEGMENSFYYFAELTRGSPPATTENVGLEEIDLGKEIVEQQFEHQQTIQDLIDGKIEKIVIDKVDLGTEEGTIEITVVYKDGTTKEGIIKMQYLNGYWYLVSIEQKS